MNLDDYLDRQREQLGREHAESEAHEAFQDRLRQEIQRLLEQFYARMRQAGNPGIETYVVENRSKGLRSLAPVKVRGWRIPRTLRVLTDDWQLCGGADTHRRRSVVFAEDAIDGFLAQTWEAHRHQRAAPQNVSTVGHQLALILQEQGLG